MKGPGLRIRNDVRRCWRCPETGNLLKTPGAVTHLYSPFVKQAHWMKLEEDEPIARKQMPLQEILERMVIVASEEESDSDAHDDSKPEETAHLEPSEKEETDEIPEGDSNE